MASFKCVLSNKVHSGEIKTGFPLPHREKRSRRGDVKWQKPNLNLA